MVTHPNAEPEFETTINASSIKLYQTLRKLIIGLPTIQKFTSGLVTRLAATPSGTDAYQKIAGSGNETTRNRLPWKPYCGPKYYVALKLCEWDGILGGLMIDIT